MSSIIDFEKVENYKVQIVSNWNKARESILEVGRLLVEAKSKLTKDEWKELLEKELPFTERTANRLRVIANDLRINSGTHASQLPNSWATLYEISKLTDEEFNDAVAKEVINPKVQRKDISAFLNEKRGRVQPQETGDPTEYPETMKFALVYINQEEMHGSDDFDSIKKRIQSAIDAIPHARVAFTEVEEQIYNKWGRENEREMKRTMREEEQKAKKRISHLIKEGKKQYGGKKKFEHAVCSSIQELREMHVDTAINLLGDDQYMFRDSGKSILAVEREINQRGNNKQLEPCM